MLPRRGGWKWFLRASRQDDTAPVHARAPVASTPVGGAAPVGGSALGLAAVGQGTSVFRYLHDGGPANESAPFRTAAGSHTPLYERTAVFI